ncbi:MAG: endonuclease/exonuclease/phosphatase family metal-dependent hydrolase [Cryomorphaceae bacterium]|jgi:endonuclease/exonuclease/phosphatase family metal-dependent hydrolase
MREEIMHICILKYVLMTTFLRITSATFLLILLSFQSKAQSNDLSDLEFGTLNNFDIATWNIRFFPANGQTTIDYVVEIIEELELDVIAIQEIDDADEFDQLLSQLQGYDGFYDDNDFLKLGYIYNIQSVTLNDQYQLYAGSSFGNPFPRRPLVMELTFMGEHDFVVINNHFKCCGNAVLDESDFWDEETRRAYASELLKEHMDTFLPDENVIMLGDLNDLLIDDEVNNVFQVFFDDPQNYQFVDMDIAEGSSSQWSFPDWPSHLDHILVSNELFSAIDDEESQIATIQIDDVFPGGFNGYDNNVSDHLPVAFGFNPDNLTPLSDGSNVFKSNDFKIFPNPSAGVFQVALSPKFELDQIVVFDQMGRTVEQFNFGSSSNSISINLEKLPMGIYSVQLTTQGSKTATIKLVIAR